MTVYVKIFVYIKSKNATKSSPRNLKKFKNLDTSHCNKTGIFKHCQFFYYHNLKIAIDKRKTLNNLKQIFRSLVELNVFPGLIFIS